MEVFFLNLWINDFILLQDWSFLLPEKDCRTRFVRVDYLWNHEQNQANLLQDTWIHIRSMWSACPNAVRHREALELRPGTRRHILGENFTTSFYVVIKDLDLANQSFEMKVNSDECGAALVHVRA